MHARDPARGMLTLYMFTRRVVRSMPAVVRSMPTAKAARHRDGVRSAMAAERTAAMTTSPTSTASAMSTATTTTVATSATAGGC